MKPILVFQTDFTYKESAVSSMYGVVKCVDRELEIFDGTHEIPQYDTWSASYRLFQSLPYWPKGTVYVSVVDPGVGTKRKGCVARTTDGHYVVTPDNGSLTHVKEWIGIEEVREIDESVNRLSGSEGVAVFHGRDVFGYTASRLASGVITYEEVGPAYSVDEIVMHEIVAPIVKEKDVSGIFEIGDPNFGNLWTNITLDDFVKAGFEYGDVIDVTITYQGQVVFERSVSYYQSFGFVKQGELVIYLNEIKKIAMAVCMGSFSDIYELDFGPEWRVQFISKK